MEHARITKAVVLQDQKTGGTVLLGYASYKDAQVNFKVPYDWETLDVPWFTKEFRETLARDLDAPVSKVDINENVLLKKMRASYEYLNPSKASKIITVN